jgi:hypothetical protein
MKTTLIVGALVAATIAVTGKANAKTFWHPGSDCQYATFNQPGRGFPDVHNEGDTSQTVFCPLDTIYSFLSGINSVTMKVVDLSGGDDIMCSLVIYGTDGNPTYYFQNITSGSSASIQTLTWSNYGFKGNFGHVMCSLPAKSANGVSKIISYSSTNGAP